MEQLARSRPKLGDPHVVAFTEQRESHCQGPAGKKKKKGGEEEVSKEHLVKRFFFICKKYNVKTEK